MEEAKLFANSSSAAQRFCCTEFCLYRMVQMINRLAKGALLQVEIDKTANYSKEYTILISRIKISESQDRPEQVDGFENSGNAQI